MLQHKYQYTSIVLCTVYMEGKQCGHFLGVMYGAERVHMHNTD